MNVWEKRLITAIKKACAANGAQTLYDGQRLCALIESADPELAQQREYKNFRALVRCGGNTLLAQSAHAPRAELQKNIETLGRSMGKGYAIDRVSGERSCALYLTAVTGDESYIRALDAAPENKNDHTPQPTPRPAPTPAPQQTQQPRPAPTPAPQPQPQPTPQPTPQPQPAKKSSRLIGILVSVVVVLIAAAIGTGTGRALVGGLFGGDKLAGTTWRGELNITKEIAAELDETVAKEFADMDGIPTDSLPQFSDYCGAIKVVADLSFSDDGAISMTINETALRNTAREAIGEPTAQWMLDCLKAISREMGADLEEMGYSDDDILLMTVGMTKDELTDYVGDYMDEYVGDALKEAADDVTVSAYYKVRGGKIYILNTSDQSVSNSPYYTFTLKDSTLVLETAVGLDEGAEDVYPLTLTKVG